MSDVTILIARHAEEYQLRWFSLFIVAMALAGVGLG
jgi:hypothetical protein